MTAARRISITVCSALALGIDAVGVVTSEGLVYPNAWLTSFFVLSGLAVVGVFFVNRWWALLPALTTVAAIWLRAAIESWMRSGSSVGIASEYIGPFFVLPVLIGAAVLSVGLLARAVWDFSRRPKVDDTEAVGG